MKRRFVFGAVLWGALAICAGAAPQSKGVGTIGGQVIGANGKALAGARVTLQGSEGKRPQTMETNEEGHFWFASLPEGLYDLRAYYQGHVSEWRKNVWVAPGEQSNVVLRVPTKKSAQLGVAHEAVECGFETRRKLQVRRSLRD